LDAEPPPEVHAPIEFLITIAMSGMATLVGVAAAWGSLRAQMKGVHDRLDRMNGRMDNHGERLDDQGQRVAHLEGVLPHGGG